MAYTLKKDQGDSFCFCFSTIISPSADSITGILQLPILLFKPIKIFCVMIIINMFSFLLSFSVGIPLIINYAYEKKTKLKAVQRNEK